MIAISAARLLAYKPTVSDLISSSNENWKHLLFNCGIDSFVKFAQTLGHFRSHLFSCVASH